jgi:Uma2 family endonuclease
MPVTVTETPSRPIDEGPRRKRWTRSECAALEAMGVFDQQHLELIEGELIDKMGKNRPHVETLAWLFTWLVQVFGVRFVNSEAPIDVAPEDNPTNEPQPDLIVLSPADSPALRSAAPQPQDLRLVVELADTTLAFDLTVKAALYARAGIVEYWVLDVQGRRLVVHRDPQAGQYRSIVAYGEQESVAPLSAPDASFRVGDVFPR